MRREFFTNNIRIILFTLLCLFYLPNLTLGNSQANLRFKKISRDEGLNHTHVLSILTDSEGFLWVGTYGGLQKYNGEKIKQYDLAADLPEVNTEAIYDIYEDSLKQLWFVGANGLYKYAREVDKITRVNFQSDKERDEINQFRKIVEHSENKFLLATFGHGIVFYDNETGDFSNPLIYPDSLPNFNRVNSVLYSSQNQILVGSDKRGLLEFNVSDSTFSQFNELTPLLNKGYNISCIAEDALGNLWVGAWDKGLYKVNAKTKEINRINNDRLGDAIVDIIFDEYNNLWLATFFNGVTYYNPSSNSVEIYKNDPANAQSLWENTAWTIHLSDDNILWVGTFGSGLNMATINNKIEQKKFNSQNLKIYSTCQLANGNVLLGTTDKGLFQYNIHSNEITIPKQADFFTLNLIRNIEVDHQNRIWIGSDKGLTLVDSMLNILQHFDPVNSFLSTNKGLISNLYIDSKNLLWLSLYNSGVIIIDINSIDETGAEPPDFQILSGIFFNEVSKSNNIVDVHERPDGNYWLCTDINLLQLSADKKELKKLTDYPLYDVIEDSLNNAWMHGFEGFYKYSGSDSTFIQLDTKNTHPIIYYKMLRDSEGAIWLISFNSLYRYSPENKKFTTFHEAHGYQGLIANQNTGIKLSDGKLLFAGIDGLIVFSPHELTQSLKKTRLYFSDLKFYNKSVPAESEVNGYLVLEESIEKAKKIIIPPGIQAFSVDFATINYYKPDKIDYAYKLEGFDNNWNVIPVAERKASYTNLKGGTYTLKIAQVLPNVNWKNNFKSIDIIVVPPLYKRLWFQVSSVLFMLGILLFFFYLRIRSIEKNRIALKKLVDERTMQLTKANKQLNETNTLLEERQQHIEEQSEELRISNDQLYESNTTKDKLFSIVAHDLKNPFSIILGMLEVLKIKFGKIDNEKRLYFIENIHSSAKQAYQLLEDILTWSRMQQGKLSFNPDEFNLLLLMRKTIENTRLMALEKKINVSVDFKDEHFILKADEFMIETILRNLVTNSIKFTPENGEIVLNAKIQESEVIINIKDTGVGMDEETIQNLFKSTTKTSKGTNEEKGTGLGLLICKEFIDNHNGTIQISSEPNKGSEFIIAIPLIK